ncbi:hypothetical protein BKA67DRAFT_224462 [Truncatella angustata]|uniref:Uncharacterized protein n=1 Tax=Truncatella angustata TaxID=152316 RepID=A0A9P8UMX4_9PEZI|nr:uncharacterized protein BKA67DRAFT_224462 [Truncatella angustata]KAH6655047.1 hypothetical protein BKA67DRAFT_224462 [Truncatella angustata]KAH8199807.1 hypothetical protein TruAng_006030 [Truncatella angustata]
MFNAKTIVAATALLAASAVEAHMQLVSPQGHTFLTTDGQNSPGRPLDATGSDFPCRNPSLGLAWSGPTNSYALGSKQQLALKGSAVHGGGSCQLSISYDTAPTKDSVFKVIHTVQGGCPARSTTGNLGNDAEMTDPFTYDYTIPSDIPAGNATIAWSWINRVGNREFYMNCGVLELTGTSGDKANFDKLPDLFVANIDGVSAGCSTSPSGAQGDTSSDFDPVIPNAGDSVEDNLSLAVAGGWGTRVFGATCASAASGYTATTGSGSGATSVAASATSTAVTTSAAVSVTASVTASVPGGVFITKTTQAATTVAPVTSATSVISSVPATSATASAGSGSASGQTKSGSCTTEGMFSCSSDGKSFQQCASGSWSAVTQMAAGTVCTPGDSTDMKIAAAGRRMAMRALKA